MNEAPDREELIAYRILFVWWFIQSIILMVIAFKAINGSQNALNCLLIWLGWVTFRDGLKLSRFIFPPE